MKTLIILTIALGLFTNMHGSDTSYYAPLKTGIKQSETAYHAENFQQLIYCCERILSLYKTEWLPYYYEAYGYINLSFIEKKADKKEVYCDKAQSMIDSAFRLKPNEPELHVLQSLLYTARMAINPWVNGPVYITKASNELETAEKLDPKNPRIYYLRGKSALYTPKFFGGGKEAALPLFDKAVHLYLGFKPESQVHPNWGKEDADRLYEECKTGDK